ncbi:MAG: methionyl-tRNA formyltransferase [Candidatus Omnitrophota bacterium]
MRIIFFGTADFAVPSLEAIHRSSHEVVLVVTQPDRKKGRHLKVTSSPVKEKAVSLGLEVFQPPLASSRDSIDAIRKYNADLFAVVSYGQILSEDLLKTPSKFCINLHSSLLPEYRGAAPINWAIINGDERTGVSVIRMTAKMDAGDVILSEAEEIRDADTGISLSERLSKKGAPALLKAIDQVASGKAVFEKQDESRITYAPKLKKTDGSIDWNLSAKQICGRVRGLQPWPSAFTYFQGRMLKITGAVPVEARDSGAKAGQVIEVSEAKGIVIKAGKGAIAVKELQLEGKKAMAAGEFLRGHKIGAGEIFRLAI